MKRVVCLSIAVVTVAAALVGAKPKPFECSLPGNLSSGETYQLWVREAEYKRSAMRQSDDGSYWGVQMEAPSFVIKDFAFVVNGRHSDIPRKALWDISNLQYAGVSERDSGVVITLRGGTGDAEFTAELLLRSKVLLSLPVSIGGEPTEVSTYTLSERVVRLNRWADEIWERTEYHK